jgi:hypothetical protein
MAFAPIVSEALYGDAHAVEIHRTAQMYPPCAELVLRYALESVSNTPTEYERSAQIAFIGAGLEFAKAKRAIKTNDIITLDNSIQMISNNSENFINQLSKHRQSLPVKAREESFTIHGSIASILGKTASAKQVMLENTSSASNRVREQQRLGAKNFKEAHDLLKQGSDGYHRTANAMAAARHARMNGRKTEAITWTGKALAGLAWSIKNDQSSLPALKSIVNGFDSLLSKQRARKSVIKSL